MAADTKGRAVFRSIIGIGALAALGAVLWFATRPPPLIVQGEVTANRVDISARVGGRIAKLAVDVGDNVKQGDVIAQLESPQLDAGLLAARAAFNVAKADFGRVNSTRQETIDARKADLAAAKADVVLYQEVSNRQAALVRSGNTPHQRVDEATRNLEAATRKQEAWRDLVEAPDHMTIVQTESMIVITSRDGRTTRLSPDGKKIKDESTNIERKTRWEEGKLVTEISGTSGRATETYLVNPTQHELLVVVRLESSGRDETVRLLHRLYTLDAR